MRPEAFSEAWLAAQRRARIARWITKDADLVAYMAEEILRDELWWAAVRSGKYAYPAVSHDQHPGAWGGDGLVLFERLDRKRSVSDRETG